ncbi:unnamed protein product [Acanthoscelides obtectus]|uniref:Letm1 RBD domain-containing protein n=1 Tax=Acanthoscelides obtectus TaxID=200917 RepID=A0A9P0JJ71_ACAOB|nr:unnamed protein product [Acanthoscelides obtectus]CAK1639685.1 LETM1 domain-containing protein 1 [Acanthoscelides obtectus]
MSLSRTLLASIMHVNRNMGGSVINSYHLCLQIRQTHRKSIYKTEAKKIRVYAVNRYWEYLKNYDKILEKRFPAAMKVYRVFVDGVKEFMKDTKEYFRIVVILNKTNFDFSKLLRREIELYHQMPKDMRKVAPILLFSSLPFAFYILLPLVYMFPKQLLSSHFWSLQQKSEFGTLYLKKRLIHNKPVFRHLQTQLDYLKSHPLYYHWGEVLGKIGSGANPCVKEVIKCKPLFTGEPYHLLYLSRNHVVHLLKMHELHIGWFRRSRLAERAFLLKEMDKAILREGGVHNMPTEALRKCCYIRGYSVTARRGIQRRRQTGTNTG